MIYTGGNPLLASHANSFPAWPAKVKFSWSTPSFLDVPYRKLSIDAMSGLQGGQKMNGPITVK